MSSVNKGLVNSAIPENGQRVQRISQASPCTLAAQVFYTAIITKPTSKSDKQNVRMPQRASIVLPSTGLPDPIRALRHPWRACYGCVSTADVVAVTDLNV